MSELQTSSERGLIVATTTAEWIEQFRSLKVWCVDPSVRELTRRIVALRSARALRPGLEAGTRDPVSVSTVGYCFDRRRKPLDLNLISDLLSCLGLEPGPARLWKVQLRRVLTADETSNRAPSPGVTTTMLPEPATGVVGREAVVATVAATPRTCISGLPGVGKTTVALAAAYRVRKSSDGRAFVVSLGRPATGSRMTAVDLVRALLRNLGVAEVELPAGLGPAVDLLRRHALEGATPVIVIDGAVSAAQVRWIAEMPDDGCTVVVTSRRRLRLDGVDHLQLPPLDRESSVEVLSPGGPPTSAQDRTALERLAQLCGGLPLTLVTVRGAVRTREGGRSAITWIGHAGCRRPWGWMARSWPRLRSGTHPQFGCSPSLPIGRCQR